MSEPTLRRYKLLLLPPDNGRSLSVISCPQKGYGNIPALFLDEWESLFLLHAGVIVYMTARAPLGPPYYAYMHVTEKELATYGVL